MKIRIILLSFLASIMICCKSDDESSGNQLEGKLLSQIDWSLGDKIDFIYNTDHTVKTINISQDLILNFNYVNNKIETLIFQWGADGESEIYRFNYDENGRINSFSKADEIFQVSYNQAENSYSYQLDDDKTVTIALIDEDVFYLREQSGMDEGNFTFNYEQNRGPLAGSNPVSLHVLMALPDPLIAFISTCFTKKELVSYVDNDRIFEFENTLDEEGYIIRRDFIGFNDLPVADTFDYTQP